MDRHGQTGMKTQQADRRTDTWTGRWSHGRTGMKTNRQAGGQSHGQAWGHMDGQD